MAAGIVYHNITTSSGVTFALACWVPSTASPDVGAVPVSLPINASGAVIDLATLVTNSGSALAAGTNLIGKVGIDQTTDGTTNKVRLPADQAWPTGMSNRCFVAVASTLTRPANTTPYAALDSISNNATAGSVTALSCSPSDTNDDPIFITDMLLVSTDTGLAGKQIRAYLYNSDPTASTGVVGGDNAAFSNKMAGYIGSLYGFMDSGFSDGSVGRLVPAFADTNKTAAGSLIVCKPTSGAKTIFVQYQSVDGFTPSANSTTLIGSLRGFQGRAA